MKTKIVYILLTFLFIGISTSVNAQTNAVLNYPVPEKKQVSKAKQNKQTADKKQQTETYATESYDVYTTDTTTYKKKTSEEKIKEGLSNIGDGMEDFMERESEAIGRVAGKAEKNGKKFLKKLSEAGKKFGNNVDKTLNKASDALSDRQISKKKQ